MTNQHIKSNHALEVAKLRCEKLSW